MKYAIFDLDGVICDTTHRKHLAKAAKQAPHGSAERSALWEQFHAACTDDVPYADGVMLAKMWLDVEDWSALHGVIYITGRTTTHEDATVRWMMVHGLHGPVYMREPGDTTPATGYKKRVYEEQILPNLQPGDEISFIMEDNDYVVEMWRKMGLTCWQPRKESYD